MTSLACCSESLDGTGGPSAPAPACRGAEEHPALPSDAPVEPAWLTQPIPNKPEPISRVSMTRKEASNLSPESLKSCQAQYDKLVQAGPNTPYLMVPSLVLSI